MAIIYELDVTEFSNLFDQYNRSENFTHTARRALFEYYDELSDGIGEPFQMDVIAICCDWSEYDEDELLQQYAYLLDESDYDLDEATCDQMAAYLQDHTTIIELDNGNYLVECF